MPSENDTTLKCLLLCAMVFLAPAGSAYADVPYQLTIAPTGDDALDSAMEDASQLASLQDRAPDSEAALRSRVTADRDRLNTVARAFGYYDDKVRIVMDTKQQPVQVTITVTPGPQYILASVAITAAGGKPFAPGAPTVALADVGLKIGQPALSAIVAGANASIERIFHQKGFPFAQISNRKAVVDHATKGMDVTYEVDPGPAAVFGHTSFAGLQSVHEAYAARRLHWAPGSPYDVTLIDKTRDELVGSNLFSTVSITTEKSADPGVAPIAIDLTERPPHSIAAGASYASTEGVSVNATWEHRNLFGEAEDLKFGLLVGQEASAATADFRVPDMLGIGWDMVDNLTIKRETATAYKSNGERLFGGFEYTKIHEIAFGFGLALEHATISDYELRQRYTLVGVPLYARRDTTDDLLDPSRGDREAIILTPYIDPTRTELTFISGRINGSIYQRLGDSDRWVAAAFGAIGATAGVSLDQLPKDKRFYAGGGGSVRGFGFQRAGPIGVHNQPLGGLSSVEAGVELRYKVTPTIGLVPFFDAGNVYDTNLPDLSRRLFLGAGIGVRYYTALGPLRLDLAAPLHRSGGDRPMQIYVSLGQAF